MPYKMGLVEEFNRSLNPLILVYFDIPLNEKEE